MLTIMNLIVSLHLDFSYEVSMGTGKFDLLKILFMKMSVLRRVVLLDKPIFSK